MLTVKVADLRRFSPDSPCPLCHGKALAVFCAPGTEIQQIHADCTPGDVQTLGRNPEAKLSVDAPHMHRHCETCGYHWLESIVSLPERLGGFLGDNPKLSNASADGPPQESGVFLPQFTTGSGGAPPAGGEGSLTRV